MTAQRLKAGTLHLRDGPIDLVLAAQGPGSAAAERAAVEAFEGLLAGLVRELAGLRQPVGARIREFGHPVARRMAAAVRPHRDTFVTPMAAVAGAVADHVLAAMLTVAPGLSRAWVNDGGDIAFHLSPGTRFEIGLVSHLDEPSLTGRAVIDAADRPRGVATSGRPGRSLSLGIADAVTVLADCGAAADVAATLIANAVDLPGHPAIRRGPATQEDPDSDLGHRAVVLAVGTLEDAAVAAALEAGTRRAQTMIGRGLIQAAVLSLGDQWRIAGALDTGSILPPSRSAEC